MSAASCALAGYSGETLVRADRAPDPWHRALRVADLVSVGVDHATAGLELRERLALTEADVPAALSRLIDPAASPLEQAVILSTCNRVEVYGAARTHVSREELLSLLAGSHGLSARELGGAVRVHRGDEVPYRLAATAAVVDHDDEILHGRQYL